MFRIRHITDSFRVAGLWLLVASVLVGPLGLGSFVASAEKKTCGGSCPCDEEKHAEEEAHGDDDCDSSHEVACGEETPCDDDCSDCSCCPGLMAGLVPIFVPGLPGTRSLSRLLVPPGAPASGEMTGIFRPPRSLI